MSKNNGVTQNVLVLNSLWQAINVCTVRRAFSLLYKGKAKVIWVGQAKLMTYNFENWISVSPDGDAVGTVSYRVRTPRVILLLTYDRYPVKHVKFTRRNIYERDGYTCQYCGRKLERQQLNIDHLIPLSRGGRTVWENVVCSCRRCNLKKGDQTMEEAGLKLIRAPRRPTWKFYLRKKVDGILQEYKGYLKI